MRPEHLRLFLLGDLRQPCLFGTGCVDLLFVFAPSIFLPDVFERVFVIQLLPVGLLCSHRLKALLKGR